MTIVAALGRTRLALAALLAVGGALALYLGRFTSTTVVDVFGEFLAGRYPYISTFFGATFLVHVITLDAKRRRPLLYMAALAEAPTIFQVLRDFAGEPPPYPFGFGLAAVAVAYRAVLWFRSRAHERDAHARALFDSAVPAYFGVVSQVFLACTVVFLPAVADLRVQHAFGVFGAAPSMFVARLFQASPAVKEVCTSVYGALPIGIAVVHAFRLSQDQRESPRMLVAFALIAALGFSLYFAFPMVGPRGAWAALDPHAVFPPRVTPAAADAWLTVKGIAPRNCMPSLHTSWALSVFLACRGQRSRTLYGFGLAWLVCTLLATLGLGEHWLIDLVVAFPFAFAVDAMSMPAKLRARDAGRIAVLVALVAAWYVVLFTGLGVIAEAPLLTGAAMATTVVVSLYLGLSLTLNVIPRVQPAGRAVPAFAGPVGSASTVKLS